MPVFELKEEKTIGQIPYREIDYERIVISGAEREWLSGFALPEKPDDMQNEAQVSYQSTLKSDEPLKPDESLVKWAFRGGSFIIAMKFIDNSKTLEIIKRQTIKSQPDPLKFNLRDLNCLFNVALAQYKDQIIGLQEFLEKKFKGSYYEFETPMRAFHAEMEKQYKIHEDYVLDASNFGEFILRKAKKEPGENQHFFVATYLAITDKHDEREAAASCYNSVQVYYYKLPEKELEEIKDELMQQHPQLDVKTIKDCKCFGDRRGLQFPAEQAKAILLPEYQKWQEEDIKKQFPKKEKQLEQVYTRKLSM